MKGPITKQKKKTGKTERESGELSGEFIEGNTVESAVKTEIDTREQNNKEWASSVGLCPKP